MLIRGSTVDKNHNPTLHFTLDISPIFFHKRLFSLSYLGSTSSVGIQVLLFIDNRHLEAFIACNNFLVLTVVDRDINDSLRYYINHLRTHLTWKLCLNTTALHNSYRKFVKLSYVKLFQRDSFLITINLKSKNDNVKY